MTTTPLNDPLAAEILRPAHHPHLGLVCITLGDEVRFRTLTRTRYLANPPEAREGVLRDLYADNLARLMRALDYCEQNHIRLYRISSALFPHSDDELGAAVLESMAADMARLGQRVAELGIRMVIHPDQFVVLSSESPQVVKNSIMLMERHARTFDLFGLPQNQWATMMIHGGKSGRAAQWTDVVRDLPDNIRNRLALENDEYAYSAYDILDICTRTGVAMVFDVHHHIVNAKLDTYEDPSVFEIMAAAGATWHDPDWQLVHLSNGQNSFQDRRHSDIVTIIPTAFYDAPWVEVEAKNKEEAIMRLRADWPDAE